MTQPESRPPVYVEKPTEMDIAVWEEAFRDDKVVFMGLRNQTPFEAATDFVRHTESEDGEKAFLAYGPDRLGRVILYYCGDRVLVRHVFRDGRHYAGAVVVSRRQDGDLPPPEGHGAVPLPGARS